MAPKWRVMLPPLLWALWLVGCPQPAKSESPAGFDQAALASLRNELTKAVDNGAAPGLVFWLERRGVVVHEEVGMRALIPTKESITSDTIFDAASLTKVVATTPCVLILIEEGKIGLEDKVSDWIPSFSGPERENITLRHLLTHTSGLRPGLPQEPAWHGYDTAVQLACDSVPLNQPGTVFRYSDINFILLGEVVRRAAGMPLNQMAEERVFGPLKMNHTTFLPPKTWLPDIAPTERDENGNFLRGIVHDPTARRMGGVAGHAGIFTTAGDLARYARMILAGGTLDGVRVLQPATIDLMRHVHTPPTVFDRRGLGWDIDSSYSKPRGDLFPIGSFGHTGFTGTALWIDPFSETFFIFLSSRLHPDGKGSVKDLYGRLGSGAARCVAGFDFTSIPNALSPRLSESEVPTVLNGIDVLHRRHYAPLRGLRLGLITNHTGIDQARNPTIDLLAGAPGIKLRALFSPEHGIRGALDQDKIEDGKDARTGLPIYSLYGERRAPSEEQLKQLDALVFDIQDIGCRFYTYISTLKLAIEAAAKSGKAFIVLDRINPLGGLSIEGPAAPDKRDFTACHDIPLRHGMTIGELARMFVGEQHLPVQLTVVPLEGWQRRLWMDETGLPWTNPSPNMRSLTQATLYPGIGLLESAVSVGRGTDTPFEILGAPYISDIELAHDLNALGLPGIRFIPERFTPTASIFKGKPCAGVRMLITSRDLFHPVETGLAIIATLQRLYPKDFKLHEVQRLLQDQFSVDALVTKPSAWRDIAARWRESADGFAQRRQPFLLYPD